MLLISCLLHGHAMGNKKEMLIKKSGVITNA